MTKKIYRSSAVSVVTVGFLVWLLWMFVLSPFSDVAFGVHDYLSKYGALALLVFLIGRSIHLRDSSFGEGRKLTSLVVAFLYSVFAYLYLEFGKSGSGGSDLMLGMRLPLFLMGNLIICPAVYWGTFGMLGLVSRSD